VKSVTVLVGTSRKRNLGIISQVKVKVKLSLCFYVLTEHHNMKGYGGMEV
jgi:hypothetical protein